MSKSKRRRPWKTKVRPSPPKLHRTSDVEILLAVCSVFVTVFGRLSRVLNQLVSFFSESDSVSGQHAVFVLCGENTQSQHRFKDSSQGSV